MQSIHAALVAPRTVKGTLRNDGARSDVVPTAFTIYSKLDTGEEHPLYPSCRAKQNRFLA